MSHVQRGYDRDREIVRLVSELGCLTTDQVRLLCFADIPSGLRKAQERLKRLTDTGRLKRLRLHQHVYYAERPQQIDHRIALNWVYIWIVKRLAAWERLESWEVEQDYGILRCDALCGIRNTYTGTLGLMFVEVDRSQNRLDKVEKYNLLYASGRCEGAWWARQTDKFPAVLCVMESRSRFEAMRRAVRSENINGLRFDVRLMDEVRGEALGC